VGDMHIPTNTSHTLLEKFLPTSYNWKEETEKVERSRLKKREKAFIENVVMPLHPDAPEVESSESPVAPIKGESISFASASFSLSQ